MYSSENFIYCCENGDIDKIMEFIDSGSPVEDLELGFQKACEHGHINIARLIYLSHKVDITLNHDYAFRLACKNGHLETIQFLQDINRRNSEKININTFDEFAFRCACIGGHIEIVRLIYQWAKLEGKSINITIHHDQAFRWSCARGHLEVVKQLYEWEPSIIEHSFNLLLNENAFQLACEYGHLEVANQLLIWKPDINIHSDDEKAFRKACANGHLHVAQRLYTVGEYGTHSVNIHACGEEAFRKACERGHIPIINQLYSWCPYIDINAVEDYAFRYACKCGHFLIVQQLYQWSLISNRPIDIMACNFEGPRSCLKYGHLKILRFLETIYPNLKKEISVIDRFENACIMNDLQTIEIILAKYDIKFILRYIKLEGLNTNITNYINDCVFSAQFQESNREEECPICKSSQCEVQTDCDHHFCKKCLKEWLDRKDTCPYCRQKIITN